MTSRSWFFVLAAALCGALLAGCSPSGVDDEAERVKDAVRAYNEALVRGYAMMDMDELRGVATPEQAIKEYVLMSALGEGRARMVAHLVRVEFGPVRFSETTSASVDTTETWDYKHVSLDTSQTIRQESGVVYRLRYELVKSGDVWLVSDVVSRDEGAASERTAP